MYSMWGKKKVSVDDLIGKSELQKEEAWPETEDDLQDKIARVLGGLN